MISQQNTKIQFYSAETQCRALNGSLDENAYSHGMQRSEEMIAVLLEVGRSIRAATELGLLKS